MAMLVGGCAFTSYDYYHKPSKFYKISPPGTFFSSPSDRNRYKIAFQGEGADEEIWLFPLESGKRTGRKGLSTRKRIDIFISNLDGSGKVNITQSIHQGQLAYFLYPQWSADGHKLAFVCYAQFGTPKENQRVSTIKTRIPYTFELYVFSEQNNTLDLVRSTSESYDVIQKDNENSILVSEKQPVWSNDSKKLDALSYAYTMHKNIFVSPVTRYHIKVKEDTKESWIKIPALDIRDYLNLGFKVEPLTTTNKDSTYLVTPNGEEIKICDGTFGDVHWTSDGRYALGFLHPGDKFYIINLKGEVFPIDGAAPSIQPLFQEDAEGETRHKVKE